MTTHKIGTRDEWMAARLELLDAEKEYTSRGDELARQRQDLPWVRIDKAYQFDTDDGPASLEDLFQGRSQLLVYHFMFGPDYRAGCVSCSTIADAFDGSVVTLGQSRRHALGDLEGTPRRNCTLTTSGWAGRFPGPPRTTATSTSISTRHSPAMNAR